MALSYLAFQAFSLYRLHFFGQRLDGTAEQKSELGLYLLLNTPYALSISVIFDFFYTVRFLGALASSEEKNLHGGWRALVGTRLPLGYTHFRLIRLFNSRKSLPISLPIK